MVYVLKPDLDTPPCPSGPAMKYVQDDISTAFLTADIPFEHLLLLKPPKLLIDLKVIKKGKIWKAVGAVYGLRAAPRLWKQSRDAKFAACEFKVKLALSSLSAMRSLASAAGSASGV
eukprot:6134707-Amphidinium_carterae.2